MPNPKQFKTLVSEATSAVEAAKDAAALKELQTRFLGRKGELAGLLAGLGELTGQTRKQAGQAANQAKADLESLFAEAQRRLAPSTASQPVDITLPGTAYPTGHRHPVTLVLDELTRIFTTLGFSVAEGPEVEDDWHNFEALNIGPDHPGRDMQDTFYVGQPGPRGVFSILPRTHTSGVQIRTMENTKPPLRIIAPGKVYRNETEDATHSAVFHQVEGLMVDDRTSFADLKGILELMVKELLGPETKLRFRPSFFPFTEPSAEVDVSSPAVRDGQWLELAGAGMVHPQVLKNVGYDPKKVQGFAFGVGIERIAMLKYGIDDLRLFYQPDVRLLEQF